MLPPPRLGAPVDRARPCRPGAGPRGRGRRHPGQIAEVGLPDGPWRVVASEHTAASVWALLLTPSSLAIFLTVVLTQIRAAYCFARARKDAARKLAADQQARQEAERLSQLDPLTGLYNRRHVAETLDHELARAGRLGGALGVLMLDVDLFKRVNDAHGHTGGDAVLVEVARRRQAGVRSWDTVARVGGEEFCVVAPQIEGEEALMALGERLRRSIAERAVTLAEGLAIPVTVSVGAALAQPGHGSAERALDCADRALYAAKRRGRNRSCRFSRWCRR